MKILVTGGAGFIASHIADKFIEEGHEVVILDDLSTGFEKNINPKAKFVNLNIGDEKVSNLFEEEKFDVVNHHAAQMDVRRSVIDPAFDANTNILCTINLLQNSVIHHCDAAGHGHGLYLIVGYVNEGRLQFLVQFGDLRACLHAQFGVQV